MTTTKGQLKRIEWHFDTSEAIAKALAPLTERGQRRILTYLQDLVTDPATGASLNEVDVLKHVEQILRHSSASSNTGRSLSSHRSSFCLR